MPEAPLLRRCFPLPRGGRIAVLAISSPSTQDRIGVAQRHLEALGYKVDVSSNVFERNRRYLAGDDKIRAAGINRLLRSPDYDAFFFARGGYGAMRILEEIDYAAVAANPRPLIGYSDLTALHQACATKAGVSSFHGPMLNLDFFEGLSSSRQQWFLDMLEGAASLTFHFEPEQRIISEGRATGILFGGCLSLTIALMGTPYDYWVDDGIWFWEDIAEPTYKIDRMLTQLRLSGRLRTLRGVMIGTLKDCGGTEPEELDRLLKDFFAGHGIPVVRDLPFGHTGNNLMLPIGRPAELDTSRATLHFPDALVEPSIR